MLCFSVQVDKDISRLSKRFKAQISKSSFDHFKNLQKNEKALGQHALKKIMGLKRKPSSQVFKEPGEDGRVYPNYFTPVMVSEKGERIFKMMRYRVRPKNSIEEIPSKYNVFNARLDALEKRATWNSIFLKNHCLFPFIQFYEWVEDKNGKKRLIHFQPEKREIMWAPGIYDNWSSKEGEVAFESFALITDEPPPEIEEAGHDRCPIFLKEDRIDTWLQPEKMNVKKAYETLGYKENVFFKGEF